MYFYIKVVSESVVVEFVELDVCGSENRGTEGLEEVRNRGQRRRPKELPRARQHHEAHVGYE